MTDPKHFLPVLFSFFLLSLAAQITELPLIKAHSQLFGKHIYAFGLKESDKKTSLVVYKLNFQLSQTDSVVIDAGKNTSENFLHISSDTLHNFLNIYLQKKEKKLVQVYRFDRNFKHVATVEDVEISHLNSISTFQNEIFYDRTSVFTIKSVNDTSGKQFYLNKYALKSELQNFEYELKWQFAFERKNINSAHTVFADKNIVLLYVNVSSGPKRGQWLLKINNETGLLIKGTKLNAKNDKAFYAFGKLFADSLTKTFSIQGQKFSEPELNQEDNLAKLSGKTALTFYITQIDSMGGIISRDEFKIPVTVPKNVSNKTPVNYILRTAGFTKNKEGEFIIETDIFKGSGEQLCYNYCNSNIYRVVPEEGSLSLEKNTAGTNLLIEKYYFSNDQLDMNGKICVDSLNEFEKLFSKDLTFNVKLAYKTDDTNNPVWLLKKTEPKKNNENFTLLSPDKKTYKLTTIQEINRSEIPTVMILSDKQFIISRQSLANRFQLQLLNW